MSQETKKPRERGKAGRPVKNNPSSNCIMVRLDDAQYARFLSMFEQSGVHSRSRFVTARIFDEEFRVVTTDRSAVEFTAKLTALYGQFRAVGVNYNQVVKELHSNFSEKKALALLYKLENATIEMAGIGREVLALCEEFKRRWLPI